MGENDLSPAKAPETPTAEPAKPASSKKSKKRSKPEMEVPPHITGRLLQVDVGASGVGFAVKGKKGKVEAFTLKGTEPFGALAASLLAALLAGKSKLRVEFTEQAGGSRTVLSLRAHS
jgi:hypothetical protein